MSNKHINDDVFRLVHRALTWKDDRDSLGVPEHWQSHAHRILQQSSYRAEDDCDGYAITTAELCIHFGIDPSLVRIVLCQMQDGVYHIVCAVDDPATRTTWIHDNNESRVVPWESVNYTWMRYMSYNDLGNWKQYVN